MVKIERHAEGKFAVYLIGQRRPEIVGIVLIVEVDGIIRGRGRPARRKAARKDWFWFSWMESGNSVGKTELELAERLRNAEEIGQQR